MSRGERTAVTGNLKPSMRDNYEEHGVAEYYKRVGSTYRNPHYPGVRLCMAAWLSKWWSMESVEIATRGDHGLLLFDLACGSGEVTLAFSDWWTACNKVQGAPQRNRTQGKANTNEGLLSQKYQTYIIPLGPCFPPPLVAATDPFTAVAYRDRTSLPCATLSFNDLAEGELPPFASDISKIQTKCLAPAPPQFQTQDRDQDRILQEQGALVIEDTSLSELPTRQLTEPYPTIEMVVCSFALHLIENPSVLFALLCTLSYKARWLVVLAPHKRPEIKEGWGWQKWNIEEWSTSSMSGHDGEILFDRVHCRIYRSVNL